MLMGNFQPGNEGQEIVSIAGYLHRPDWHELIYDNDAYERVPGGLEDAAALAEALKLEMMPERVGMVEWRRRAT